MTKIRIGVTGFSGYVGQELMKFDNVFPLACDVRIPDEIERAIVHTEPDIVVHLASISDIEQCEDPKNLKLVDETNVRGTFYLAEATQKHGVGMCLLSTSQVFDGRWGNYKENSKPSPLNYYGLTKMVAEGFRMHFENMKVIRTSYLFDYERLFRHLYPLRAGQPFEYPTFIQRSFMYLPHFIESLYSYLSRFPDMPKMLHISGCRTLSWYEFIREMANEYELDNSLVKPRRYELQNAVPRPHRAGLHVGLSRKLGLPQYSCLDGLSEMRAVAV